MASGIFVKEIQHKTVRNRLAELKQGQASEGLVAQGECTSANGLQSLGAASPPVRRSDTARGRCAGCTWAHGLNVRNKHVPLTGFSAEQRRRLLLAHAPKTPP